MIINSNSDFRNEREKDSDCASKWKWDEKKKNTPSARASNSKNKCERFAFCEIALRFSLAQMSKYENSTTLSSTLYVMWHVCCVWFSRSESEQDVRLRLFGRPLSRPSVPSETQIHRKNKKIFTADWLLWRQPRIYVLRFTYSNFPQTHEHTHARGASDLNCVLLLPKLWKHETEIFVCSCETW